MGVAGNYLRQAEDIRRERVTIQAAFPEPVPHASQTKIVRGATGCRPLMQQAGVWAFAQPNLRINT